MVVTMKIAVMWIVMPCSLVDVYQHTKKAVLLLSSGYKMEASHFSEMLLNIYLTVQCQIQIDGDLESVNG
jgi:hypothetical protein